ncbi:hypothetical protein CEUSTIGMA_g13579.t1 [Chlamydomonas eustigma]|uniref:Uncharacterized protein n=1 Tax=Chlamydomonas eustigma TaxID=1157962 RepID=A0A250XT05_9CHLO|nr:hypothetical protein CEUSTIGMA_g13579.t1 [Chlamydomonas eustigma]|eukprot:GAX86166.1 hypothetical protein CEUSTIGMA_g13579.t1 [Chlamydomonas eustigma]
MMGKPSCDSLLSISEKGDFKVACSIILRAFHEKQMQRSPTPAVVEVTKQITAGSGNTVIDDNSGFGTFLNDVEGNLHGSKRHCSSSRVSSKAHFGTKPPISKEAYRMKVFAKIGADSVPHVGQGHSKSYWTDQGLTLESQYKAVPDFKVEGSLCEVEGSPWLLTVHMPAVNEEGHGHVDCLLCGVELKIKKGVGIDTIRQHACTQGHTMGLWALRIGAKIGMGMKIKHMLRDVADPVVQLATGNSTSFADALHLLSPSLNLETPRDTQPSTILVEQELKRLIDGMKDKVKKLTKTMPGGELIAEVPMTTSKTKMVMQSSHNWFNTAAMVVVSKQAASREDSQYREDSSNIPSAVETSGPSCNRLLLSEDDDRYAQPAAWPSQPHFENRANSSLAFNENYMQSRVLKDPLPMTFEEEFQADE